MDRSKPHKGKYTLKRSFYQVKGRFQTALSSIPTNYEPGHLVSTYMSGNDEARNLAPQSVSSNRAMADTAEKWVHDQLDAATSSTGGTAVVLYNVEAVKGSGKIQVPNLLAMLLKTALPDPIPTNPNVKEAANEFDQIVPLAYRIRVNIRSNRTISSTPATTSTQAPMATVTHQQIPLTAPNAIVKTPEEVSAEATGNTLRSTDTAIARNSGAPVGGTVNEQTHEFTINNP
jgi:hypothetical protein